MKYYLSFLLLAGCNLAPSQKEWSAANFGKKPDALALTDDWIHRSFFDPEAAQIYNVEDPQRTCYHPGLINPKYYGWTWFVDVNGRNQFGGYTGRKTFLFFYRSGLLTHREGANFNDGGRPNELGLIDPAVQYYFRVEHVRK